MTGGPCATGAVLLASSIHLGQWKFFGSFAALNLIAATTNALNGALLARRPDHYRGFTVVGILLMALLELGLHVKHPATSPGDQAAGS